MKNTIYSLLTALTCTFTASAVTINFNDLDADTTSLNAGGDTYAVTTVAGATDLTYSFTSTGNIDNLGIANDTLSFDIIVTGYSGSTFDGTTLTLGTPTLPTFTGPNWDTNDTLGFELTNIVYTRGETVGMTDPVTGLPIATVTTSASSLGVSQVFTAGSNNVRTVITGEGATTAALTGQSRFQTPALSGNEDFITQFVESGGNTNSVRDLEFSIEVSDAISVPEPTSSALLGLAGLALVSRRKR